MHWFYLYLCSCSILSSDEIVPFCAGVLENDTFYHQNLLPTTDFNLFDASSEDTPCFDLVRRHLCYHYYPVCNTDTGDVVPICSDNCDILNSEQSCVDLLTIVISDVEARGRVVPEMQCSVVQASNNSQVTSQCLDINNGNHIISLICNVCLDQIEYLFCGLIVLLPFCNMNSINIHV